MRCTNNALASAASCHKKSMEWGGQLGGDIPPPPNPWRQVGVHKMTGLFSVAGSGNNPAAFVTSHCLYLCVPLCPPSLCSGGVAAVAGEPCDTQHAVG